MDLSRLTSRQQVKYLEKQAAVKEQEVDELDEAQQEQVGLQVRALNEVDNSIEIHIGSWTSAIVPSTEKPLKVKVIMSDDKDNEEDENVKVRLKRLRTTRRIAESDDDEENEVDGMEEDQKVKVEPVLNKLLGRIQQTKEKREEVKKVKKKQEEKETKPATKTQLSIPKKSGVPRKSVDPDKEKASSLLAEYKKTKPAAAKTPAAPTSEREPPKKKLRKIDPTPQPVSDKPDLTRSPIASDTTAPKKSISLNIQIWDSLHDLCTQLAHDDKDSKFRLSSSGSIVDLSGSLLKHREYDFFDVDKNGVIVVPPKVPIFPEDFPPGKPEWPLSWWGIVDPALGERKNRKVLSTTGEPVESSLRISSRSSGPVEEDRQPRRGRSLNGGRGGGPLTPERRGRPHDQRGHPSDHRGLPPDHANYRGAPPGHPDHRGPRPPPGYRGPPLDHSDYRGPPPDHPDYRGPPPDHPDDRGPPLDRRGPPQQDRRGPPQQDRRGPPPQDRRGPRDIRGPPPDHPDYQGPPSDRPDYRGPPPPDRGPRDRHADDRRPRHSDDRGSRRRSDKDRGPSGKRERKHSTSPER